MSSRPATAQSIPAEKPQSTSKREFNAATHGLRGIASLGVFWAHLLGGTAEHIYDDNATYVNLVLAPWHLGSWGVQLFFVISGFVILPSIRRYSLSQFALRRFLRLYPLFFAFSLAFIILNALTNEYPGTNNPIAALAGLTFLNLFTHTEQLTPNAWSLTYEVMFYTLAAVGFYFAFTRKSKLGTLAIAILSALFLFRYPIASFFLGGVIVRLVYEEDFRLSNRALRILEVIFGIACVLLASSRHYDFSQADMADPRCWGLLACTTLYFFLAIQPASLTTLAAQNRILVYLGTVSYSLYLVHPYTYYLIRALFGRFGLFGENWALSMLLFFVVTTPVTLVLTHFAHRFLEVGPYQWFFHQRIYQKNKPT